ncbi:MAG: hypothetical protein PHQ43_15165 [Dehalococcoidales bacterium]|jgi:hypothetical protein|nr:hypothetical protein [Dehalococcoidales bacterium]
MKGYKIETLEQLMAAAEAKKAVVMSWGNRMPAAFVMCMQASQVCQMMRRGMWIYVPEKKQRKKEKKNDEI